MISPDEPRRDASATGFPVDAFEKVCKLLEILAGTRSHPFLKSRLALKGGTALNLFLFDVPRLSVDVDVNYVGAVDRQTMLSERPKVEQALTAVCARAGLKVRRVPTDHAGGKWRLQYETAAGQAARLELDVNFMLRVPLWAPTLADSRPFGRQIARGVPVLDLHELAAGKLAALFSRTASRDLFDVRNLLHRRDLDMDRLRLAFVVYGGMNRRDWRRITLENIQATPEEVGRQLVPMLRTEASPSARDLSTWTTALVRECRDLTADLVAFRPHEVEFLDSLNARGEILPDALTDDRELRSRLDSHPGLLWKAHNVRSHRG